MNFSITIELGERTLQALREMLAPPPVPEPVQTPRAAPARRDGMVSDEKIFKQLGLPQDIKVFKAACNYVGVTPEPNSSKSRHYIDKIHEFRVARTIRKIYRAKKSQEKTTKTTTTQ